MSRPPKADNSKVYYWAGVTGVYVSQALYRKYRSKSLDEVVGQEHITTTLKNALKSGKISHAYLFTGPRGVGKTSIARILAHEVNQLPYEDETTHLDIIEIDAASNRRIDEIRDLRDKVHITPTSAKYKVYIIDEVHMLTKEAFNALLKTLEEPPGHVIFILATTEAHKLPETIISRTQRFTFKPIETTQMIAHLKKLAKAEAINVEGEALALIAEHSEGSFRDSISLLDQASNFDKIIRFEDVQRMLGIAPQAGIDTIISILASGTPKQLLEQVGTMREQGFQAGQLAKQLGQAFRQQLVSDTNQTDKQAVTKLLKRLLDIPASTHPDQLLEIVLLDALLNNQAPLTAQHTTPTAETQTSVAVDSSNTKKQKPGKPLAAQPVIVDTKPAKLATGTIKKPFSLEVWPNVLASIKTKHNTLYSVLRMGKPSLAGQTLTLTFAFGFHQKRVNESKNRQLLNTAIEQYSLPPAESIFLVKEQPPVVKTQAEPVQNAGQTADIETISNIFGGAELLES